MPEVRLVKVTTMILMEELGVLECVDYNASELNHT